MLGIIDSPKVTHCRALISNILDKISDKKEVSGNKKIIVL